MGAMSAGRKIAIFTFGTRVSPRFDCAPSVLVVVVDDGKPLERREIAAPRGTPHKRIDKLLELGVDTVICGGIDRWSVDALRSAGVTVYYWVAGEAEDALAAVLQGRLDPEATMQVVGRRPCRRFPCDGFLH